MFHAAHVSSLSAHATLTLDAMGSAARGDESASDRSARFAAGISRVSAAALAFRDVWKSNPPNLTTSQQMERDHQRAQLQHQRDVQRYTSRLRKYRRRARNATGVAVVSGTVALADFITAGPEVWFWIGAPTAVLTGWAARSNSAQAKELSAPTPPRVPPPPPRPLPVGVIGHTESVRLSTARVQMAQLLPTIEAAHESAATEVRSADAEAAPALGALVERLAALNRVIQDHPGTAAARSAQTASQELRVSISAGVEMYEELLQAAVELLGAPGSHTIATNRLHISVDELAAYSEGLRRASEAVSPEGP